MTQRVTLDSSATEAGHVWLDESNIECRVSPATVGAFLCGWYSGQRSFTGKPPL